MASGRVENVFINMADADTPDELSKFRLIENGRTFIVSNCTGSILLLRSKTGERLQKIDSHKSIITNMIYDPINNLILSSSSDSFIKVQKISNDQDLDMSMDDGDKEPPKKRSKRKGKSKDTDISMDELLKENLKHKAKANQSLLRVMEKMFDSNGVDFMDLSLEMNLIACASCEELIVFLDYEYFKVVGAYEIKKGAEVTAMMWVHNFQALLIADNTGMVQVIHVGYKYMSSLKINKIYEFNVRDYIESPDKISVYCNLFSIDSKFTETSYDNPKNAKIIHTSKLNHMEWYFGINDGSIIRFDVSEMVEPWVQNERAYNRANYNAIKQFAPIDLSKTSGANNISTYNTGVEEQDI
jgi:WD40 repeat protein